MPDAMTAPNPLTAPPALGATAQPDTTHTPTQAHRTITENGQPTYLQDDSDDPKPELASELAAEGDSGLTPVRGHWAFHDRDGNPYYEESPDRSAPADPTLAGVGKHWADRDSSWVMHYVSNKGVTVASSQEAPQRPVSADTVPTASTHPLMSAHKAVTLPGHDKPLYIEDPEGLSDGQGATELSPVHLHHVFGEEGEPPYYIRMDSATPQILRSLPVGQPRPEAPMPSDQEGAAQLIAALFTAALWEVIGQAGEPRANSSKHTLARRVFDPEWLAALALPSRENIPEHQLVTLADGTFARYPDTASMLADYERVPRTWIFERAHRVIPWLGLTADYLGRLSASPLEVLAAVFDSRTGDKAPMMHWDEWHSVIVQFDGAKQWTIGTGPDQQQLTTEPGDVLLIPEHLAHIATTPPEPGHSRHITLGLSRHTQYTTAAADQDR